MAALALPPGGPGPGDPPALGPGDGEEAVPLSGFALLGIMVFNLLLVGGGLAGAAVVSVLIFAAVPGFVGGFLGSLAFVTNATMGFFVADAISGRVHSWLSRP